MNPIYRGQYPPKNTNVLWIKDNQIYIYQNGGWASASGSGGKDAEDHLSETSENLIQNKAVYNQYMTFDDIIDVLVSADPNFLNKSYLTFRIVGSGNIIWNATDAIQYNKNGGGWETLSTGDSIEVAEKDQISFKGNITMTYNSNTAKSGFEDSTAQFIAFGNALSLANDSAFSEITTISNSHQLYALFKRTNITDAKNLILSADTLSTMCYANMFDQCSLLRFAPKLPATTLAEGCYFLMFQSCVLLEKTPDLPATTLAKSCYYQMFRSCFALTKVSELPAETATENCYYEMFAFCKSLTVAPELPATTLAKDCYFGMFDGCGKLKESPILSAKILTQGCYDEMFYNCSSLNKIVCYATDISATNCTATWVNGVASKGTFVYKHGTVWTTGINGIPEGWTVEEYIDPMEIPLSFYFPTGGTFEYCYKTGQQPYALKYIDYAINDSENWTTLEGPLRETWGIPVELNPGDTLKIKATGSGTNYAFFKTYFKVLANNKDIKVFGNIMSLVNGDDFSELDTIPNTANYFCKIFKETDIQDASELLLPATSFPTECYSEMFYNCVSLKYSPKELPATTLTRNCYASMFYGCTELETAPFLPATTTVDQCYYGMLRGCPKLKEVTCLITTISSPNDHNYWLYQSGTDVENPTFKKDSTMLEWTVSDACIPSNWTIVNA